MEGSGPVGPVIFLVLTSSALGNSAGLLNAELERTILWSLRGQGGSQHESVNVGSRMKLEVTIGRGYKFDYLKTQQTVI